MTIQSKYGLQIYKKTKNKQKLLDAGFYLTQEIFNYEIDETLKYVSVMVNYH